MEVGVSKSETDGWQDERTWDPGSRWGPQEIEFGRKWPNRNRGAKNTHHQTKAGAGFICVQGRRAGDRGRNLGLSRLNLDCGGCRFSLFQLCTQQLGALFGSSETGLEQFNLG